MPNIRRHKRYDVDVMAISCKIVLAKSVKVLDMSVSGLLLQTEKRMNPGSQYSIKLEGKGRVLTVRGNVVWSLLSESVKDSDGNIVPMYKAGIEFIDVSDERVNEIASFLEVHKRDVDKEVDVYSPSGRRPFTRILIEDPEKAILNFPEGCTVKNLSLSGMFIEGGHALELENTVPMEMTLTEGKSVKFLGRIASCLLIKDKNLEHYGIGIEFVEMSEGNKEKLEEFIRLLDKDPSFP
jgi:hypothetical protein